jgi:ribonuclease P protein component
MKRRYRLRHHSDFQRVRREGRSYASPLLALAFLQNELEYSRFGFVVSKRLGKATQRNKIKRRMREAVRRRMAYMKPGFDLVVIGRQPIRQASYAEIEHSLEQLLKKAGLRTAQATTEVERAFITG